MPKIERHIMRPIVASERVLMKGGNSGALTGNGFDRIAKNAAEEQRRRERPPKIAATAAAVTDAERFEGVSIQCLYIISSSDREERERKRRKRKVLGQLLFLRIDSKANPTSAVLAALPSATQ
jgi:hypothetical protein